MVLYNLVVAKFTTHTLPPYLTAVLCRRIDELHLSDQRLHALFIRLVTYLLTLVTYAFEVSCVAALAHTSYRGA